MSAEQEAEAAEVSALASILMEEMSLDDTEVQNSGLLMLLTGALDTAYTEDTPQAAPVGWLRSWWNRFWEVTQGIYYWFVGAPDVPARLASLPGS